MPTGAIHRAMRRPALTGEIAGPWAEAEVLTIDQYPWYASGVKQATIVRLLWDAEGLYAQFHCEDRHSSAAVTALNGPVCNDSCVELFATVDPAAGPDYVNIEINCCGTFLVGFGPGRPDRRAITPEQAATIRIAASIDAPTKAESPDDRAWWVAAAIPWETLGELAGRDVTPEAGTRWRGNLYRCGGLSDPQFAAWSLVDPARWPKPDFHRPEAFGELIFTAGEATAAD